MRTAEYRGAPGNAQTTDRNRKSRRYSPAAEPPHRRSLGHDPPHRPGSQPPPCPVWPTLAPEQPVWLRRSPRLQLLPASPTATSGQNLPQVACHRRESSSKPCATTATQAIFACHPDAHERRHPVRYPAPSHQPVTTPPTGQTGPSRNQEPQRHHDPESGHHPAQR